MIKKIEKGSDTFNMFGEFYKIFKQYIQFCKKYKNTECSDVAKMIMEYTTDISNYDNVFNVVKDLYVLMQYISVPEDTEQYWEDAISRCRQFVDNHPDNRSYAKLLAFRLLEIKEGKR